MWTLIFLHDVYSERYPDIVPTQWTLNDSSRLYPKDFKFSTIKSYAKNRELPYKNQWTKCKIEVIEQNIGNWYIK